MKLKKLFPKNKYLGIGLIVGVLVIALFVGPRLLKKKAPVITPTLPVSSVAPSAPISPVAIGSAGMGMTEAGNPFYTAAGQTDVNETSTIVKYNPTASMRSRAYQATSPYRQNRVSI